METTFRLDATWGMISLDTVASPVPAAMRVAAWSEAVRRGRLDLAAIHRRGLEALVDEEPTWEDAAWQ